MEHNITWDIDKTLIPNYQNDSYSSEDFFSITDDNKYGVLIYNIRECSMCAYYGLFAIYNQINTKVPLINYNIDKQAIHFNRKDTFYYAPLSDCFVFVHAANKKGSTKPSMPYFFVNPSKSSFAFLQWDYTSIYYGFKEVSKGILQLIETSPKELELMHIQRRTGEQVNLDDLTWYDIKHLSKAYDIYHGSVL
jgi:hypothetical protein